MGSGFDGRTEQHGASIQMEAWVEENWGRQSLVLKCCRIVGFGGALERDPCWPQPQRRTARGRLYP